MKTLINGKLYYTDTDVVLCKRSDPSLGWMSYASEALCRNRTGDYYLYASGGAIYSLRNMPREIIIPLDIDGAKKWAATNMTTNDYIAIWGMPTE